MNEKMKAIATDAGEARERIEKLRQDTADLGGLMSRVPTFRNGGEVNYVNYAVEVIDKVLQAMRQAGLLMSNVEAGHGIGHFRRDYVNALRIAYRLDLPSEQLFLGLVGGALHEIGCTIVERYTEAGRVVRHAEASALLLEDFLADVDATKEEKLLLMYVVAAHTHYLRPVEIKDADGRVVNTIQPYPDMVGDKPFYPVWLTRWADRLDTNGPCHIGRHYFTLLKEHEDFDGEKFYKTDFAGQMRPIIRSDAERGKDTRTMAEHLLMYANSQTNDSPYGRHDFGEMQKLRDSYRGRVERAVAVLRESANLPFVEHKRIMTAWTQFLAGNIEPSDKGLKAAEKLEQMFERLPDEARGPWLNVFRRTMAEYVGWSAAAMFDLSVIGHDCDCHWEGEVVTTILPAFEMP